MRNIWTVFKTDIRTLSRCFFACVVVVAIALLPSLYAWLNIYSNWDPYGNTGGISIAVASLDEGYTDEAGKIVMGGCMTGLCAPNDQVVVMKGTNGILVFNEKDARSYEESPCIRCGRCKCRKSQKLLKQNEKTIVTVSNTLRRGKELEQLAFT